MVGAIGSLGGDLKEVTINDVSEGEMYRAQVHVLQGRSLVVLDFRPSDAITLAAVCNIPVYVERLVWQKTFR